MKLYFLLFTSAELLVDKAMDLRFVGGHYGGNVKPTPFLCLILKMLQIQPDKDIIIEFIRNDHKYVFLGPATCACTYICNKVESF